MLSNHFLSFRNILSNSITAFPCDVIINYTRIIMKLFSYKLRRVEVLPWNIFFCKVNTCLIIIFKIYNIIIIITELRNILTHILISEYFSIYVKHINSYNFENRKKWKNNLTTKVYGLNLRSHIFQGINRIRYFN